MLPKSVAKLRSPVAIEGDRRLAVRAGSVGGQVVAILGRPEG